MDDGKNYEAKLNRFFADFSIINNAFLKYKKEADRLLSSDFTIFDYLSTKENALSDYFAMMLDVNGPHGQGGLFQNLFLEFLSEGENGIRVPPKTYHVYREYYCGNGRIDILLRNSKTAIIIENKPYTGDSDNQLTYYLENIGTCDTFLIYISPSNEPSCASIKKEKLDELKKISRYKTVSLFSLGDIFLRNCAMHCESQKFRYFIDDFKGFLISTFKMQEEGKDA
ncbi:MAG: PD-(D/E)XK nuclease family protein [Thermotogota bacterium]|nr:PD-(D/E)XK nuclease family protein [Thermotogota bacterium]